MDPLAATTEVTSAGAVFARDATGQLEPLGVREFADRFTVALLHLYGTQRPTQIADELRLHPQRDLRAADPPRAGGPDHPPARPHPRRPRAVVVALTPRGQEAAELQLDVFARHTEELTRALSLAWGPGRE